MDFIGEHKMTTQLSQNPHRCPLCGRFPNAQTKDDSCLCTEQEKVQFLGNLRARFDSGKITDPGEFAAACELFEVGAV